MSSATQPLDNWGLLGNILIQVCVISQMLLVVVSLSPVLH